MKDARKYVSPRKYTFKKISFITEFFDFIKKFGVIAGNIKIGSFINDIINFVILLLVVYMTIKIFLDRFLSEDEKKSLKM